MINRLTLECWPLFSNHKRFMAQQFVSCSNQKSMRQGPAQDVPYDLILWYVSKIIYLL